MWKVDTRSLGREDLDFGSMNCELKVFKINSRI